MFCATSARREKAGLKPLWSKPGPPCMQMSVGFSRIVAPSGLTALMACTYVSAHEALVALLQRATRADIAAAGDDVAAVRWLAWHQDIRQAQDAYLAHNQAWQDYLTRAIEDPAEFARPQDAVNSTFEEAEPAVREALPPAALYRLKARVAQIFAPPPSEGDGQQA